MLISELGIRGFRSYGNSETTLKLNTDSGELIPLALDMFALSIKPDKELNSRIVEQIRYIIFNQIQKSSFKVLQRSVRKRGKRMSL